MGKTVRPAGRLLDAANASKPLERFEKKFIESFPYYLGLTENAIQYLVDTELDDEPKECDSGTVCHQRFSRMTWPHEQPLRLPVDWVFDHPTRDIAEYLRETFVQHKEDLIEEGFSFCSNMSRLRLFHHFQSVCCTAVFCFRFIILKLSKVIICQEKMKNLIMKND